MKKALIVLGLLIASFSFNSCKVLDDLKDQECEEEFHVNLNVNQLRFQIVSSTLAAADVDWSAQKFYCDGYEQSAFTGKILYSQFNANQYAELNVNLGWRLKNTLDYIIITATLNTTTDSKEKTVTHRFDYNDVPDGEVERTMVVDFVFNIK
jgi:hypothetical protein